MKTAIKRVLLFLFLFVILFVFAVRCFRAPSVGASETFSVTHSVFGERNKTDYELNLIDIDTTGGVAFCLVDYAYGTPSEAVNVSFSGVDSLNVISNDYISASGYENPDYTAYLFWAYVTDVDNVIINIYNSASADQPCVGFIPNCDTVDLFSFDNIQGDSTLEKEVSTDTNYIISCSAPSNTAITAPIQSCSAVDVNYSARRNLYMFDGTTSNKINFTWRYRYGALGIYRVYNSASGGGSGDTTPDTGQQQLEVSNNILTNIKTLIEYVWNLPTNIRKSLAEDMALIKNTIESIPNAIADALKDLFVPEDNYFSVCFDEVKAALEEKFPFIAEFIRTFDEVQARLKSVDAQAPVLSITYDDTEIVFIDFSIFNNYIGTIRAMILTIVWVFFIIRQLKKVPGIIHGQADTNAPTGARKESDE